jgi:hypothetical protein
MANGKGRLIHPNGCMYEGHWENDLAHGFGKYLSLNGANYQGEWKMDK